MEGACLICPLPSPTSSPLPHSTTRRFAGFYGSCQKSGGQHRRRKFRLFPENAIFGRRSSSKGEKTASSLPLHGAGSCSRISNLQQCQSGRRSGGAEVGNAASRGFVLTSICTVSEHGEGLLNFALQKPRKSFSRKGAAKGGHPCSKDSHSRLSSQRQQIVPGQSTFGNNKILDKSGEIFRASCVVAGGAGDETEEFSDCFDGQFGREQSSLPQRKASKGRLPPPQKPQQYSDWILYAIGTVGSAAAGIVAARGIQSSSAHASVQNGGGDGQSLSSGSGGGGRGGGNGGGGGGDGGGSEGGGSKGFNGHEMKSGFWDPSYEHSDAEEKLTASVSVREKVPASSTGGPLGEEKGGGRVKSLASLSSATGEFGDGEAAGKMHTSRKTVDAGDGTSYQLLKPDRSQGGALYGARSGSAARDDDSGTKEDFRHANVPESVSHSGPYLSKAAENQQTYKKDGELGGAYQGPASHHSSIRHGDVRDVPPEFSSIRGKIKEIPGFGPDGAGNFQDRIQQRASSPKRDLFSWLGGILHSMGGSITSGPRSGKDDQDLDEECKRSLVMEVAARTLQMISEQPNETGLAKSAETGALRRLQRETFADLVKIRDRLSKVEYHSGLTRASYSGEAGAIAPKTSLKGEVSFGTALVLIDGLANNLSHFALQHAGLLTGLDVRFIFETIMRENDVLLTQCGVGQFSGESDGSFLGGPISLQKITYTAQINDNLSVSVSPTGSRACDMADSVKHLQGQALTSFGGGGPALYKHCKGSSVGATLRSDSILASIGQYLSGWGSRAADATASPLCLSTLAQIMIQPFEHMVLSLSAVNSLWPSPPLPSSNGFHWSEMGPLVLSKMVNRPTQSTGTFTFNDLPSSSAASFLSQGHQPERDSWSIDADSRGPVGSSGTAMQSVAFAGELDLGGHVSLGGWAQVERADWVEEQEKKEFQWNLSLAKSTGSNVNWGLSMGRRKREDWAGDDGSASPRSGPHLESTPSQLQMEAFVKVQVGRGFTLQPGLVYILDKDTQTPVVMLRSSWSL